MTKPKPKRQHKRLGRTPGRKNTAPKPKRSLTPVQKLREHVLIELGVDKKDIAEAIGATRQNVSHVFYDEYRSDVEEKVVAYLQERYLAHDDKDAIRRLFPDYVTHRRSVMDEYPITLETLGWSRRSAPLHPDDPGVPEMSRESIAAGDHRM